MKVAILGGEMGAGLAEETQVRSKSMVEIWGHPILSHIMIQYSKYRFDEFLLAFWRKGNHVKKHIIDYCVSSGGPTVNIWYYARDSIKLHRQRHANCRVDLAVLFI